LILHHHHHYENPTLPSPDISREILLFCYCCCCSTVHLDNIKVFLTNKCTIY
jgi:hypothetical protein